MNANPENIIDDQSTFSIISNIQNSATIKDGLNDHTSQYQKKYSSYLGPIAFSLQNKAKEIIDSIRNSIMTKEIVSNIEDDCSNREFMKHNDQHKILTVIEEKQEKENNVTKKNNNKKIDYQKNIHTFFSKLLMSNISMIFFGILTIYSLFADDFKNAFTTKKSDIIFNLCNIFCITSFTFEILITLLIKRKYFGSFFFFLDFISTITLIFDLTWVQESLSLDSEGNVAKASQFAKIGARAGRMMRLVRIIRVVKVYKNIVSKQREKEKKEIDFLRRCSVFNNIESPVKQKISLKYINNEENAIFQKDSKEKWYESPTLRNIYQLNSNNTKEFKSTYSLNPQFLKYNHNEFDQETESIEESRVGRQLIELTIKRVIVIVFLLLIIVPLFDSKYYSESNSSHLFGIQNLNNYLNNKTNQTEFILLQLDYLNNNYDQNVNVKYPIINLIMPINYSNYNYYSNLTKVDDLRNEELEIITINSFTIYVDKRNYSQSLSYISIGRTIFICIVLSLGAMFFTRDTNRYALNPLGEILAKVNEIAKNPLTSKTQKLTEINSNKKKATFLEMNIIENAIIKITTLLVLGFGEAGSEMISNNMNKTGDLIFIAPGQKVYGIFGFCDIRNFTDTTEVLQEEVMVFVNNIAEIVHSLVDRFQGSANKNIGDAFLLVWKFKNKDHKKIEKYFTNPLTIIKNKKSINNLCDLGIMSFLKIISKINRKLKILEYRRLPKLINRIPNYKVKMGFGMHLGWAIEGGIGSEFKIDASYLSPNVNLASRLEAATKQYGVNLLFSETLFDNLSNDVQKISRKIDKVTLKGSNLPLSLYTIDFDTNNLKNSNQKENSHQNINKINNLKKMGIRTALENKTFNLEDFFSYDKDLKFILENFDSEFHENFLKGVKFYLEGNWQESLNILNKNKQFKKENDGPTTALLHFMKSYNFVCPLIWNGYRELSEK